MITLHSLLLVSALCAPAFPEADAPKGHLVIHGGGPSNEAMMQRALTLAGGPKAKILVVPQASSSDEAGPRTAAKWTAAGALNVAVLDIKDLPSAKDAIKGSDLIWFGGGDQMKLVATMEGTGILEAIRERYRQGATVGGTSAGAAVMSSVMIARSAGKPGTAEVNQPILADGFGLWPGVIVDQHYLKRRRGERLLRAVRNNPQLLGVGIDESTAVIVSGTTFEVVGASEVVVIDARKAPSATVVPIDDGDAADQSDLRVKTVRLKEGMMYDLDRGIRPREVAEKR